MQDKQAPDQQPQDPKTLSHLNPQGEAQMVDVSAKAITHLGFSLGIEMGEGFGILGLLIWGLFILH